jgi:phage terminase large subunit
MGEVRRITIPYAPRSQFTPFHDRQQRWAVIVAHRRAGKTVACINDLIKAALTTQKPDARFGYLAPFHAQAKDVAWDYLVRYSAVVPGIGVNISELRIDLPNGSRIRLYGAENAERLRGLYLDGVVIDEPADIDPRVWPEIIRPALADRQGWAVWIGTPKGRNAFYELYAGARGRVDWFDLMLKASETGLVAKSELDDAKRSMSEDQYAQEFECSFDAAVPGAYYAKLIQQLEDDKRITRVAHDPALRVATAWDLGIGDSTAIWFAQTLGNEVRLIDYYEASGVGLDHYAKVLKEKRYIYRDHILPHDANAKELGTGRARVETLESLGIEGRVLPIQSVDDGINSARMLLPRCWFDAEKCGRGLEALRQYRCDFDEKLKAFKPRPRHDWTSHAADAFRYLAEGIEPERTKKKPPKSDGGSWMS